MKNLIFGLFLFFMFLTEGFAATCADYNTLAGYGIIGETKFTYGANSVINDHTISGTGTTPTPIGVVQAVYPALPPFEPAIFPVAVTTTKIINQSPINPGSYQLIDITTNHSTTIFNAGTYSITELKISDTATIQLAPGDYYIDKLVMGNSSSITISPSGPVRLFINTSFKGGNQISINAGGSVQNLIIYLYSKAEFEIGNGNQGSSALDFNGIIYSPFANTEIQLGNNNNVQGAILSAGEVQVGNNTQFNYSTAVQNAVIGAFGCGPSMPPNPLFYFDAWDTFRSISDRNISTKIVNKPFNLTIAALNSAGTTLQNFNGTVCATIVNQAGNTIGTATAPLLFTNQNTSTASFSLNRAVGGSDSAGIKLFWKNEVTTTCPLIAEDNTTIASDRFSVRPSIFAVSASNAVAGTDFNISFTAQNFSSGASADYNETAGSSFDVNYAEHNVSCPIGAFNPVLRNGWAFANGSKVVATRYNEAGVVDINISDTAKPCSSRYAWIDCDDSDISGFYNSLTDLPIGQMQAQITIRPHHFDINATLTNVNGGAFTYLSTDLNMSAKLDLNVTAKNGEGNTTKNYDKGCYAKSTTLALPHSVVPIPLSKIFYHENLSGMDGNVSTSSTITMTLPNTVFTQGSAPLVLNLNFDRDRSRPLNPFDFNISDSSITDTDNVTGSQIPMGTATFLYGRVRAYDIKTDQPSAPNPIEFEIYSTTSGGYVSTMPQNVLHWYRNLNHDLASQGHVIRGGFSAGTTDGGVNVSAAPLDGLHAVTITSSANQTVHLDITPWLWYSPLYNYNYLGNCTRHPCFDYQFFGTTTNSTGVSSGTFQGSDFNLTPAKTIIKKGVKVFR